MTEAQPPRPRWARLGRELRRLRDLSGLTQRQMASALKVSQTTIDRLEAGGAKGGKPPPWPQIQAWAGACSAAQPDLDLLRDLTEAALDEHTLYRNLMGEGLAAVQEDIRAEEAAARTVLNFVDWGVPGLLQTTQYARRVLTLTDYREAGGIDEAVQARLRRQELLHEDGRRFGFVVTEEGLRRRVVPVAALAVQLAHLADVASLPAVTLSVIPRGVAAYAIPVCGFTILDDLDGGGEPWVAVETLHKRVTTSKPDEVDIYRAQYGLLQRSAVQEYVAVTLIREIARSLRD